MSQEANNWAHTSERGNAATALAGVTGATPSMVGGAGNPLAMNTMGQQSVVNSAELRPYQSGRLGLDSEMGVGIDHHGPNGPYPTRAAGVSDPHQQNVLPAAGVNRMHNEIAIPVASGGGTSLLANHMNKDRNHDGIPDRQQRDGNPIAFMTHGTTDRNHDGIPDSQQRSSHLPHALDKNNDGRMDILQKDVNAPQQHGVMAPLGVGAGIPATASTYSGSHPSSGVTTTGLGILKPAHGHHTAHGAPSTASNLATDRNHDGIPDSQQHQPMGDKLKNMMPGANKDKNHDGIPDRQQRDLNRDGIPDNQQRMGGMGTHGTTDRNHDGIPDNQQHLTMGDKLKGMLPGANKDKNHDGIPDRQQHGTTALGTHPTTSTHTAAALPTGTHTTGTHGMKDRNHDGIPDSQQHQTMGQKIAGIFGGNKDKNHDGIPDKQQHGTTATTAHTTHTAPHNTVDVSNKPTADIWVPKQFGRMPPGSTIKDPAHHPGFATSVVTENIPVTDELGREATITKQTVITTQDTVIGQLHRDHDHVNNLFQSWFNTRDVSQREKIWWELEHELLNVHEGHTGIMHSSYNKYLTKEDGYDHHSSFHGYNDMHTLTGEMGKMNQSEAIFETKMTQLYGMYNNYRNEQMRYLPLMERKLNNQQLIDLGTSYNLKKSNVKNTKHTSHLNDKSRTSTATTHGTTSGHTLSERDREHTNMASKHSDEAHHPTLKERIFGVKHTDTTTTSTTTTQAPVGGVGVPHTTARK